MVPCTDWTSLDTYPVFGDLKLELSSLEKDVDPEKEIKVFEKGGNKL